MTKAVLNTHSFNFGNRFFLPFPITVKKNTNKNHSNYQEFSQLNILFQILSPHILRKISKKRGTQDQQEAGTVAEKERFLSPNTKKCPKINVCFMNYFFLIYTLAEMLHFPEEWDGKKMETKKERNKKKLRAFRSFRLEKTPKII